MNRSSKENNNGLRRVCVASVTIAIMAFVSLVAADEDDRSEVWSVARGGQLYDKWWAVLGHDKPKQTHPAYPAEGKQKGDSTWRCKECHGWDYRGADGADTKLLRQLLSCDNHHARAAAVQQLRHWRLPDSGNLLRAAANDPSPLVRMEAAIAASWVGTRDALDAMLDIAKHPRDGHLLYAFTCALGSHTLRRHWEAHPDDYEIVDRLLGEYQRSSAIKEPKASKTEARFDRQPGLKTVRIGCVPERMRYSVEQLVARPGQPLKIVFFNNDATDHNLVFVRPGALAEVGMAANEMARDPKNATSDFIPAAKEPLILHHAPMIGPTRKSRIHVLRFLAPTEPGI